jgi:hypothetical protein
MKERARMVIMSHLSDAQELNGVSGKTARVHIHINFAKFLILKYADTDVEIDPDAEYAEFCTKYKIQG